MASELKIFSGICMYKGIDFTFIFDLDELRLIPPEYKSNTIRMEWIMTRVAKGVYTMGNPLTMDDPVSYTHLTLPTRSAV